MYLFLMNFFFIESPVQMFILSSLSTWKSFGNLTFFYSPLTVWLCHRKNRKWVRISDKEERKKLLHLTDSTCRAYDTCWSMMMMMACGDGNGWHVPFPFHFFQWKAVLSLLSMEVAIDPFQNIDALFSWLRYLKVIVANIDSERNEWWISI